MFLVLVIYAKSLAVAKPTVRSLGLLCMGSKDSIVSHYAHFQIKKKLNGRLRITTCFQRRKNNQFSTLKQRHISTLKQRQISTLIRFNKIECLLNVEVRRCFNLYLPAGTCPIYTTRRILCFQLMLLIVFDCGLTSHSAIFQLYSDGTDVQFPNFDLLPGTHAMGS